MPSSSSKTDRRNKVWKKSGGRCSHCGKKVPGTQRTIDHYIPKVRGGTFDSRNLMPLCKACNKDRGCKLINPRDYYKYASTEAIQTCIEYEKEFISNRTSINGEVYL